MNLKSICLIISTLSHLKVRQLYYQVWYRLRKKGRRLFRFRYNLSEYKEGVALNLTPFIPKYPSWNRDSFTFIELNSRFTSWNDASNGMLWAYNLNYMDFIHQEGVSFKDCKEWIDKFINEIHTNRVGMDPYPIALRGINWIKFISIYAKSLSETDKKRWNSSLYAQYRVLLDNLEYHLLGNHLLEDAFSLFFAALYFKDKNLYEVVKMLLHNELSEQVLPDGANYEQSPMYHCILLDRLLDCYNAATNNIVFDSQLSFNDFLKQNASSMLGHLASIVYADHSYPLFNDAAEGIAPLPAQIFDYAKRLGIEWNKIPMKECGYRKLCDDKFEGIVDVGNITATYQPGHTHADTFNYELKVEGARFIVDTGISTYNKTLRRQYERGTKAHNTVVIGDDNSSQVWGGFRVGRRAQVCIMKDTFNEVEAVHNGFGNHRKHTRSFVLQHGVFSVKDMVSCDDDCMSVIHLDPKVQILSHSLSTVVTSKAIIQIVGARKIEIVDEKISRCYNTFESSQTIYLFFNKHLSYSIMLKH